MLLKSLAAIGLVGDDGLPSAEWIVRIAGQPGETIATPHGTYKHVRIEGGGEVWIDIGADGTPQAGKVIGMTPFHDGVGAVEVEVQRTVALDSGDTLVGAWAVRLPALARGDLPLPVTLEIVPYRLHPVTAETVSARVRMLAIALEATVYPSTIAYLDRTPKSKLIGVGAVSPQPVGAAQAVAAGFAAPAATPYGSQPGDEQRCVALVSGRIEDARQIVNPLSRQPYFWLAVETDRGPFNVVASGRTLLGAAPLKGAVLQARVRLIATPAPVPVEQARPARRTASRR